MTHCSQRLLLRPSRLVSSLLSVLVLTTAIEVSAHKGHGNEFHQSESSQSVGAIEVDAATAERIGLKVEPVKRQLLAFGVQATGQIEASPSRRAEVTNPVGGTVVRLLVEPGQAVKAGQPLAIITSGELAELRVTALENSAERRGDVQQAQANLRLAQQTYQQQQQIAFTAIAQARTELRVAQEKYDRDKELAEQGAMPRRQSLESEAHLAEARKALSEAESRLEVLSARNELERAQTGLEVARSRSQLSATTYRTRLQQLGANANPDGTITIKAPIAGTIADRQVTLGQSTEDAGATLMTIVDDRTVLATANIFEKDLNQVSQGQRVRVTVSSLPEQVFEGRITTIGSVVEGESRVVPVKAELGNSSGVLKPGMFAELEVLTDSAGRTASQRTPEPVLAIPQSAVVAANGRQLVFVQNGTSFQPVDVTLGRQAGNLVEVKSGLFDGDRVVTQRANQLYAQSLRGESTKPEEAQSTKTNSPIAAGQIFPLWVVIPASGAVAVGTFAAGVFWANRRNRRSAALPVDELSNIKNHRNGHHSKTPTDHEPILHTAETHRTNSDAQDSPHEHR